MSDMRRLLEAMDSMSRAEKKPMGPKFPGYLKGTDPASKTRSKMVGGGCEQESVIPELATTAKKKSTEWDLEEAFKQFKEAELPEGQFGRQFGDWSSKPTDTTLPPGYGTPLGKIPPAEGDQSGGFKKVPPGVPLNPDDWSPPPIKLGPIEDPNIRNMSRAEVNKELQKQGPEQEKFDTNTFDTQTNKGIKVNTANGTVEKDVLANQPEVKPPVTDPRYSKDMPVPRAGQPGQGVKAPREYIPIDTGKPVQPPPSGMRTTTKTQLGQPDSKLDISPEEMDDITQQKLQQQKTQQSPPAPAAEPASTDNSTTLRTNLNKASAASNDSAVKAGTTTGLPPEPKPGSWQELAKLNNITDPTKLKAGTKLITPDGGSIPVNPGDTLGSIARTLRTGGEPSSQIQQKPPAPEIQRGRPTMKDDPRLKSTTSLPDASRTAPAAEPVFKTSPLPTDSEAVRQRMAARDAESAAVEREYKRQQEKLNKQMRDNPTSRNRPKPSIVVPESLSQRLAKDFEKFLESDEPYAGYDQDVEKLKQRAKLGPMKTVWDEKIQRYRVVPVKPQEKEIKEYGNAQNADQQATNPSQQQTSHAIDPSNPDAMAQRVDIATAKSTMSGLKNILGPQLDTNAAASGIVKMNDGQPLSVPERQAISTLTPLVTKAAEMPATASALKSALSTAGVLSKQGK